jgi:hypothetical protein
MRAYKFLRPGAVGPFSGHRWPVPGGGDPGAWVEAAGGPALCRGAVHGCRVADLPWWVQEELWEAEFDAPVAGRHKIAASRGRLVRRIAAWEDAGARDFADACAWRARDHAVAALERAGAGHAAAELRVCTDLPAVIAASTALAPPEAARISVRMAGDGAIRATQGASATAAYIAAHAAAQLDGPAAPAAERAWQAAWLREALGLRDEPLAV